MKIRFFIKQGKLPDFHLSGKTEELFFWLPVRANGESAAGRPE
jgi:hypothetical protein